MPEKLIRISDEESNKAWDTAFDKPVSFDHKPTADEIVNIRLRAVAQAQLDADLAKLREIKRNLEAMNLLQVRFDANGKSYTEIPIVDTQDWQSFWQKYLGEEKA